MALYPRPYPHLGDDLARQASELPKLPGKKLLNSNTTAHLSKRVGRYGDYLNAVLAVKWAAHLPTVASFLTDEGPMAAGSRALQQALDKRGSHGGESSTMGGGVNGVGGGGGWVDVDQEIGVDQAVLMAEVAALRRRVEKLDKMHASWSRTLQQLLFVTLFHPRRTEEHRQGPNMCICDQLMGTQIDPSPTGRSGRDHLSRPSISPKP